MSNVELMLRLTCLLLGIWGLLISLQWFASRSAWRAGGAGGWDLHRLRASRIYRSAALGAIFSAKGHRILIGVQLAVSLALIVLPIGAYSALLLALFWLVSALLGLRSGADGGDKMALVVTGGAILQSLGLLWDNAMMVLAGLLWTAGQLVIAYTTSGASKLFLRPWRNGDAPRRALSSYMWGHRWAAVLLDRKGVAAILGWLVILPELLFLLALLAPGSVLLAILACFFLFHWAIAFLMGINSYPWAFAAAYPSVYLLSQWLRMVIFN
jgi:hypothetical protein